MPRAACVCLNAVFQQAVSRMQLEVSTVWLIWDNILYLMLCHVTLFDLLGSWLSRQASSVLAHSGEHGECQAHWPADVAHRTLVTSDCRDHNPALK